MKRHAGVVGGVKNKQTKRATKTRERIRGKLCDIRIQEEVLTAGFPSPLDGLVHIGGSRYFPRIDRFPR